METCEVLIVGGGPAGSTCAWKLKQAGVDVLLLDSKLFPRDKPCAGWLTPAVIETVAMDCAEYRQGRVLQEIHGFRTGLMQLGAVVTDYGGTVSYAIRRLEFDQYLLQRSATRQLLGVPVTLLERNDGGWIVNGRIRARLLVGAGGHSCPVARLLGAKIGQERVIVAQSAEYELSRAQEQACLVRPGIPELFFSQDLKGYGWILRKGKFLNIGFGRMGQENFGRQMGAFRMFVEKKGALKGCADMRYQGHAYLAYERHGGRRCLADGALLVGDAAGLSYPLSGEGILPAVESALIAADTILKADGDYRFGRLEPYAAGLAERYGRGSSMIPFFAMPSGLARFLGARLLSNSWFTRHVALNGWFLHSNQKQFIL